MPDPEPGPTTSPTATANDQPRRELYAAPEVTVLGSLVELTRGSRGTHSDLVIFQGSGILSDAALKDSVQPVDVDGVLDRVASLPISSWSYVFDDPEVRHIGPMAQDFAAAFDVGVDNRHIHPVDASGVALAALKALAVTVDQQRSELAAMRIELDRVRAELGEQADSTDELAGSE